MLAKKVHKTARVVRPLASRVWRVSALGSAYACGGSFGILMIWLIGFTIPTEIVHFIKEWKELAGAALGVMGAFGIANLTNRQNTRNAMRQTEAVLLKGDIEEIDKDIVSLRRHSNAAADYYRRLTKKVDRLAHVMMETQIAILSEIKEEFCDSPLPKELDLYSVENDPRGITDEMRTNVAQLHAYREGLKRDIQWAINPRNLADEVRDRCISMASSMSVCTLALTSKINSEIKQLNERKRTIRESYSQLRRWDHG